MWVADLIKRLLYQPPPPNVTHPVEQENVAREVERLQLEVARLDRDADNQRLIPRVVWGRRVGD